MTIVENTAQPAVHLPPKTKLPKVLQTAGLVFATHRSLDRLRRIYGPSFTLNVPGFGHTVMVSDPALIKQLFMTSTDIVGNMQPNLGIVLGAGSLFSLEGAEHHRRRKLLVPPFHGKRMLAYEKIVEEEVLRETATWVDDVEFETLEPMMRVTLNVVLRTVFGAEGEEFDELRELLPPLVLLASRIVNVPVLTKDLGRWSPGGRHAANRRRFDRIIDSLVNKALADPHLEEREDVLALLLQARYDDGEAMSRAHLADELLTLLAAGHETTATTLAWVFERLRRHPGIVDELVQEVDEGGSELLKATILEVQRTRPVIELTARRVNAPTLTLGEWVIPQGYNVMVGISLVQSDESVFPHADVFDPGRFVGVSPDTYSWVPFGGGTRRCVGAAFATMEMTVTLRTILQRFEIVGTREADERRHSRGVAMAPSAGGRLVVRRRDVSHQTDSGAKAL